MEDKEAFDRDHKNVLHPPDRKTLLGNALCKCHFLHHRRTEDAGRRTGGEPQLRRRYCFTGNAFCQEEVWEASWINGRVATLSYLRNKCAYFIATCGDSMGNTPKYLRQLCEQKKFTYMGCAEVVMPENYIAVFNAPERKQAVKIIKNADIVIKSVADVIKHNGTIPEKKVSGFAKASSGIINTLFYHLVVSAKKFYATDACIGCGKCADVCPLNNVSLKDSKPVWGNQCTHCMACICKCPKEAIEYGNRSKGKPRYQCPL